jgi:hypothetical protein
MLRAPSRLAIGSENFSPITDAVSSTRFSRSGRRPIRAASKLCTVAGRPTASTGVTKRYAPGSRDNARLDQRLDDLLDEERLPPVRSWTSSRRRCSDGS